jgi:uncharacterized protein YbaP (TraB family)
VIGISASQAQLLWKVSGNGLKHPSYLFGTHHLIPIQFLDSVPGLYKAFNESEVVVGELALNSIDATSRIQNAASMPNHTKMTDLLKGEKYTLVDGELRSLMKLGLKEFSMMNPTLILSLYQIELYKKKHNITDDTQSDSYFQLIANEKDKKVVGLETVEQQIEVLFGNGSLERQADILYETVAHKQDMLNEMALLDRLYKTGKIDKLVELSKGTGQKTDPTDDEYAKLVDNRNAAWLKKLPDLFKGASCFVAVGAAHLGGKNGLIKQLEKEGYHVKPVN